MGNCGSVHKTQDSSPKSKLKCSSFSRTGCILTEQPIQENTIRTVMPGASSLRELINGKEDMQFSSDPRLESDCEDFFSVNGDLTPSSTNTPIHRSSPIKSPATDVKKQLIELFHESFNDEAGHQDLHYESEAESSIFHLPQNSANKTPYESVADIVFRSVAISNTNSEPRTRKKYTVCTMLPAKVGAEPKLQREEETLSDKEIQDVKIFHLLLSYFRLVG